METQLLLRLMSMGIGAWIAYVYLRSTCRYHRSWDGWLQFLMGMVGLAWFLLYGYSTFRPFFGFGALPQGLSAGLVTVTLAVLLSQGIVCSKMNGYFHER